jgi:hypothetical protein
MKEADCHHRAGRLSFAALVGLLWVGLLYTAPAASASSAADAAGDGGKGADISAGFPGPAAHHPRPTGAAGWCWCSVGRGILLFLLLFTGQEIPAGCGRWPLNSTIPGGGWPSWRSGVWSAACATRLTRGAD